MRYYDDEVILAYLQTADPTVHHRVDPEFEHVALSQRPRTEQHRVVELRVYRRPRRCQATATQTSVATVHAMETHLTEDIHTSIHV